MKQEVIKRIVREEIVKLHEYYAKTRVEPGFKIKTPWPNQQAETALKRFGAKPFSNGINPHGYELDTKRNAEDRLWFYEDGSVWSTNATREMGYGITGNTIELWNQPGYKTKKASFQVGKIKLAGTTPVITIFKTEEPGETESKPNSTIDTIQTVLDWAGLIPGIGDIIDVINAIIYFAREKWFDGFLSIIAVIPVVGSVIKLGAKSIYRGAKLYKIEEYVRAAFKSKDGAQSLRLWDKLVKDGAITTDQLKDIGTGLDYLSGQLRGFIPRVKQVTTNESVLKQLDDLAEWLKVNSKSVDELADASKRGLSAAKGAFKIAPELKGIENLAKYVSMGAYKRLRGLGWFKQIKVDRIAKAIERKFFKQMSSPTNLTALFKTMPDSRQLRKTIVTSFNKNIPNLPLSTQKELAKKLGIEIKDLAATFDLMTDYGAAKNSKFIQKYFDALHSTKGTRGLYDTLAYTITKQAKDTNNILWSSFATDNIVNLKTALDPRFMRGLDLSLRKNIDVIWNEVHDMFEDIGVEIRPGQVTTQAKYDELDGLIWPMIKTGVGEYFPGTYDAAAESAKWVRTILDSDTVQGAEDFLRDKSQDPYKVIGKGRYK